MKLFYILIPVMIFSTESFAQAHINDNLWYNNGAAVTVQPGTLITVQGDMTNNGATVTGITHLNNNGFIWLQGNAYGDNAFKQTGTGTLRLQNKTALYTAPYAGETYQVIQGGYRVNGGQSAIAGTTDGSVYDLELDNQAGYVFVKTNTDVRNSVDFKPASVTVDGNTIAPNGVINRILTYDPGSSASPASAPSNGANYTAVFGMMNNAGGLGNFKNLSTNLAANTTVSDNAYIQGKLRRALNTATGGSYGFPMGLEPGTSSTSARGIQYAVLNFTANNYDVLTGYFQQGSDNTVAAPGTVCSLAGGFQYYGSSNHGEWIFSPQSSSTESYDLTIYPQDYGTLSSTKFFITKDNAVPVPGTQSCGISPDGLNVTGIKGFSEFGFAGGNVLVPVKLLSFTGQMNHCIASLNWKVADEQNLLNYQLQYSLTGYDFSYAGTLLPAGTNSNYQLKHTPSQPGKIIYRLKMTDVDGQVSYSNIVTLYNNCGSAEISVFPNPANTATTIWGAKAGSGISLYNTAGSLLLQKKANGSGMDELDLSRLPEAVYIVKIIDRENNITVIKLCKK